MRVKEVMSTHTEFLAPGDSLAKVAEEMRKHDYGFMPIGEGDKLIGIVTDRDITIRGVAKGKKLDGLTAKDVMTKKVLYCYEDQPIEEVAKNMGEQQVHRLIVLDRNKRLKGVISLGDIARKCKDEQLLGQTTEEICEKTH